MEIKNVKTLDMEGNEINPKDVILTDKQIEQIAKAIDIKDVRKYVDTHFEEYQEFLKTYENENK